VGVPPAPIVTVGIMCMQLGLQVSLLFYVIPAVAGVQAAIMLVRKETKGTSLEQSAQETALLS